MGERIRNVVALLFCCILLTGAAVGCGGKAGPTVPNNATLPVSAGTKVTLYFLRGEVASAVVRTIAGATSTAGLALNELLRGPTPDEQQQGLTTAIPDGTLLNSFSVEGGVAKVDFSKELAVGGGSARIQAIMNQINQTVLANDPNVKTVEVTVAGVPAEQSLQP